MQPRRRYFGIQASYSPCKCRSSVLCLGLKDAYVLIRGDTMRRAPIITAHCAVRARQRGYRHADFEMVESTGTWMREGIFVRRRHVESKVHRLRAQLRRK